MFMYKHSNPQTRALNFPRLRISIEACNAVALLFRRHGGTGRIHLWRSGRRYLCVCVSWCILVCGLCI